MELLDPYYGNQESKQAESNNYPENGSDQLFTYKQEEQYQNGTFKSVSEFQSKLPIYCRLAEHASEADRLSADVVNASMCSQAAPSDANGPGHGAPGKS